MMAAVTTEPARPLRAHIDPGALRHNLGVVRRLAPGARVLAVVKADAYGHGLLRTAVALGAADGFAVLNLAEAERLRAAGHRQPLLLLEGFFNAGELPRLLALDVGCVVHSPWQLQALEAFHGRRAIPVWLKFNTGMNRLGFAVDEAPALLARLEACPSVGPIGLMTHFATADETAGIESALVEFAPLRASASHACSLANSAAILRFPASHADWVRPGIMLYGVSPLPGQTGADHGLRPAMTLRSALIGVQTLQPGDCTGYGRGHCAVRPQRIGIVACGYADGYPRHAPNGTPVLVNGVPTTVVGRVSMDMLTVDLTPVPEAGVGAAVTLWGDGLPVERVADAAGTIGYELLCALAPRVPVEVVVADRSD